MPRGGAEGEHAGGAVGIVAGFQAGRVVGEKVEARTFRGVVEKDVVGQKCRNTAVLRGTEELSLKLARRERTGIELSREYPSSVPDRYPEVDPAVAGARIEGLLVSLDAGCVGARQLMRR